MKRPQLRATIRAMRRDIACLAGVCALPLLVASPAVAACPCNTVQSGPLCVDQYEASIWETKDPKLIEQIKQGTVCSPPKGATQKFVGSADYSLPCSENGGQCTIIFALSLPQVKPATAANWFIAAAACRNSGKRLLTNGEWQAAALGTPDDPAMQCNVSGALALTGTRIKCKSDVGAYDMVGNVSEWVQDWGPLATATSHWGTWSAKFGNDVSHMGGSPPPPPPPGTQPTQAALQYGLPGGTTRGGSFGPGSQGQGGEAGVYAIDQGGLPASYGDGSGTGFRCGR
jgi:hypothetical protein